MTNFREQVAAAVRRVNGWVNAFTAVGYDPDRANRLAYDFAPGVRQGPARLEALYHEDAFAARIVEAVPKHALRRGFTVKTGDPAIETAVQGLCDDLGVVARVREAWTWARVFGGGAVLLGADDGTPAEEPLDAAQLRGLRWLASLTAREVWPERWELDPRSPRFGEPVLYRLQRTGGGGGVDTSLVHHTRLVRFDGLPTTRQRRAQLMGWGESYLQRAWTILREWNGAHAATETLLQDASQGVLAMKDLMLLIASDPEGILKRRLEMMDLARSSARSVLLDADGESFTRTEVSALGGIANVLDRMSLRLSGASEIPVSILLGQAPAGMDATGEADQEAWRDAVGAEQRTVLLPALTHIVRLLFLSSEGPTGGQEPEGWSIVIPQLREPTEEQKADLRLKVAQTDQIYTTMQALTPEEVATSRFKPEGWSMETTIDLDARRAAMEADRAPPTTPTVPAGTDDPTAKTNASDDPDVALVLPAPSLSETAYAVLGAPAATARELHLTLAYLGKRSALDDAALDRARGVLRMWASTQPPMEATINGLGRFVGEAEDPVYFSPDAPALADAREQLVRALAAEGIALPTTHGFVPHITLARIEKGAPTPRLSAVTGVTFTEAALWAGDTHEAFPLAGGA